MNNLIIFCDFDGTITKEDTINKLLSIYGNDNWLNIENLLEEGIIGSKECLIRQIECIDYISEEQLNEFIASIEIDDYFIEFLSEVNNQGIELYIVSDGFRLLINSVLDKFKIKNIKVFSNDAYYKDGKLIPFFPFHNVNCEVNSGLCKCDVVRNENKGRQIIYIGDGVSDRCASKFANILFAKGKLADYCSKQGMDFIRYDSFNDIKNYIIEEGYLNVEIRPTI